MTSSIYRSEAGRRAVLDSYRRLLALWPVPREERVVPTREGDTFVVSSGPADAPALVLLHGASSSAHEWLGDVAAWSSRFRVHAVDVIGEAGLSAPLRPPIESDAYAGWLDDVLDGLGLRAASLVGRSFGGFLALRFALARQQRVRRLVLLAPAGLGRQRPSFFLAAPVLMVLGRRGRGRLQRLVIGPGGLGPGARPVLEHLSLVQQHLRPRVVRFPAADPAELARLEVPVLAIVGARDALFDSEGTRRLLEASVPDVEVRILPHVGHAVVGQTQEVLAFLAADGQEPTASLRDRIEADMRDALRRGDRAVVAPLRSMLSALDNATAVPLAAAPAATVGRSGDVPRKVLSEADERDVLRRETDERRHALATYTRLGREAEAERLRAEIAVLERYHA